MREANKKGGRGINGLGEKHTAHLPIKEVSERINTIDIAITINDYKTVRIDCGHGDAITSHLC